MSATSPRQGLLQLTFWRLLVIGRGTVRFPALIAELGSVVYDDALGSELETRDVTNDGRADEVPRAGECISDVLAA